MISYQFLYAPRSYRKRVTWVWVQLSQLGKNPKVSSELALILSDTPVLYVPQVC